MTLTPLDIHNKEFSYKLRGYSENEVDEFLDEVVKEFEALIRENGELKDRLDEYEQAMDRYRRIEDSLNKTLLLAQQSAEDLRETAEKEAAVIRERATVEAQRIVDEARERAKQAIEDYAEIRREAELFRMRMKTLLSAQLEIFEEAALKEAEAEGTPFGGSPRANAIADKYAARPRDRDDRLAAARDDRLAAARDDRLASVRDDRPGGPHEDRPGTARGDRLPLTDDETAASEDRSARRYERPASPLRPNLWGEPVSTQRPGPPGRREPFGPRPESLSRGSDDDSEEDDD